MNSKINRVTLKQKKSLKSDQLNQTPNSNLNLNNNLNLKSQSTKIQSKLQSLKSQIAMRKTMRNKEKLESEASVNIKGNVKNNTGESWGNKIGVMSTTSTKLQNNTNIDNKLNQFLASSSSKPFQKQTTTISNPKTALQSPKTQCQDVLKLQKLLQQLNMTQFYETIVNKYQIDGLQKLLQLKQEDIQKWKNVPIGYRVKIKKIIIQHKSRANQHMEGDKQNDSQKKQANNMEMDEKVLDEDIENIIKRRKTQKIYQPIRDIQIEQQYDPTSSNTPEYQNQNQKQHDKQSPDPKNKQKISKSNNDNNYNKNHKYQQNNSCNKGNNNNNYDNDDDEQDILISSLNLAFMQRRSIIKKQSNTNININSNSNSNGNINQGSNNSTGSSRGKNKVHWGDDVKEYNKESSQFKGESMNTKYPKNIIQQQKDNTNNNNNTKVNIMHDKSNNNAQFCWNCLKKITKNSNNYMNNNFENHTFCSTKCKQIYNKIINPINLKQQQQQQHQQYQQYQQQQYYGKQQQKQSNQQQYQQKQQRQEDNVDLDLF